MAAVLVPILFAFSMPSMGQAQSDVSALAFEHVTVIDVESGRAIPEQTVVVTGNRIVSVGSSRTVPIPQGAHRIAAVGKYLVPGFWDMHTHVDYQADKLYPRFIANGVTGVRGMGQRGRVTADSFRSWQRQVLGGKQVGPRAIGPSYDVSVGLEDHSGNEPHIKTEADVVRLVDSLHDAGDAFIKFHGFLRDAASHSIPDSLLPPFFFAMLREARRVGIPVVGHVPSSVGIITTADSGMLSVEHVVDYGECLTWPDYVSPEPIDTTNPKTMDGCRRVADALIRNGTWVVPTIAYMHFFERNGRIAESLVRLMHQFGVRRFLTGTDFAPWQNSVPYLRDSVRKARAGMEALDEVLLLAESGLSSLEALQAATLNPAKYLRGTDSLGTVAPGKLADLVLLDANPLADIHNIKAIRAVVANGHYFDRAALDALDPEAVQVRRADAELDRSLAVEWRPAPPRADIAFRGATVIDVTTGQRLRDQTVVVAGKRIRAMGPARDVAVPPGAKIVDARGKYLIPGLWDMSAGADDPDYYRYVERQDSVAHAFYPRFIAAGVTGIREPAEHFAHGPDSLRAWQRQVETGARIGPRAVGPSVEINYGHETFDWNYGVQVASPEDAVRIMDSLAASGDAFAALRLHDGMLDNKATIYFAMTRTARRARLPLVGPVPDFIPVTAAADSGQGNIELDTYHRCGPAWSMASDSIAAKIPCASWAEAFVRNRTWVVPALARAHYIGTRGGELTRVVGELRDGGVTTWLAGSGITLQFSQDTSAFQPGRSLADELVYMVAAGLTPLEALQSATLNPARYLGATDSLGTVAPGKLADLVLLDADPLADIQNIRRVGGVVANGRYFDRPAIAVIAAPVVGATHGRVPAGR